MTGPRAGFTGDSVLIDSDIPQGAAGGHPTSTGGALDWYLDEPRLVPQHCGQPTVALRIQTRTAAYLSTGVKA